MFAWHDGLSSSARKRLSVYPRLLLAGFVLIGGYLVLSGPGLLDRFGKPIGVDFVTFYAASVLVRDGQASRAYDLPTLEATESAVIGVPVGAYAFHYPPPVLALTAPLSLVPYTLAIALFTLLSLTAFVCFVQRTAADELTRTIAFASPALFQTIIHGQNGVLTTWLLWRGLTWLDARPVLAGATLAGLGCKPQFVPLVALALLVTGRWRAIAGLLGCGLVLGLISLALLGPEPWQVFVANLPFATKLVTTGALPLYKMPTITAALLLLGAPVPIALGAQLIGSCLAALVLVWILRRGAQGAMAYAALAVAMLAALPFGFEYDWVLSVVALLWLTRVELKPTQVDLTLWASVWLAPLLWAPLAQRTHLQLAPFLAFALLLRIASLVPKPEGR